MLHHARDSSHRQCDKNPHESFSKNSRRQKKSVAYAFPADEVRASMPTSRKYFCCTTQCSTHCVALARVRRYLQAQPRALNGSQHRKHSKKCHYPLRPLPQLQIRGSESWERWKKRSPAIPMTRGSSPRVSATSMATLFLSGCRLRSFARSEKNSAT